MGTESCFQVAITEDTSLSGGAGLLPHVQDSWSRVVIPASSAIDPPEAETPPNVPPMSSRVKRRGHEDEVTSPGESSADRASSSHQHHQFNAFIHERIRLETSQKTPSKKVSVLLLLATVVSPRRPAVASEALTSSSSPTGVCCPAWYLVCGSVDPPARGGGGACERRGGPPGVVASDGA